MKLGFFIDMYLQNLNETRKESKIDILIIF